MTRVLVHGGADVDDPAFVHNVLSRVNRVYGPISCLIHMNNDRALAWQQWAGRRQVTRHLPIIANWHDGAEVWSRLYTRLFDVGRPDVFVVIEAPVQSAEEIERVKQLIYRAIRRSVPVYKFAFNPAKPRYVREVTMDVQLPAIAAE